MAGAEKADAVTRLDAQFDECAREAGDATKKLLGPDGLPKIATADHLRARVRKIINGIQEARGKRAVVHGLRVTVPHGVVRAQCNEPHRTILLETSS